MSYIPEPSAGSHYSFSPNGRWLAVDAEAEAPFAATVYDLATDEPLAKGRQVGEADVSTTALGFADDGKILVVSAFDHHIYGANWSRRSNGVAWSVGGSWCTW